jgi:hypothetical protein
MAQSKKDDPGQAAFFTAIGYPSVILVDNPNSGEKKYSK